MFLAGNRVMVIPRTPPFPSPLPHPFQDYGEVLLYSSVTIGANFHITNTLQNSSLIIQVLVPAAV